MEVEMGWWREYFVIALIYNILCKFVGEECGSGFSMTLNESYGRAYDKIKAMNVCYVLQMGGKRCWFDVLESFQ